MKRTPSICEMHPGMCCADMDCPDDLCPGHPMNRYLELTEEEDEPLTTPEKVGIGGLIVGTLVCVGAIGAAWVWTVTR